jgi:hypothetical protein
MNYIMSVNILENMLKKIGSQIHISVIMKTLAGKSIYGD